MKPIFYILCILWFSSCGESTYRSIEKNHLFSIEVPKFLKEVENLNPDATLQLSNEANDFLVMVIVDSKEDFIQTLEQNELQNEFPNTLDGITLFLQQLHHSIENAGGKILRFSEIKKETINSLDAREYSIEAEIDGEKLYYAYTIIEGDSNYYQIMSWTYLNMKDKYLDDFQKINHSFKELQQ